MKTATSTLLAAALVCGAAAIRADAQTPGPNRLPFGTGSLADFLKPYDLDGDGKLSEQERQAYLKAMRDVKPPRPGIKNPWDTDGDGKLSEAERQAARDAIAAKMKELQTKRFNELDVDKNGLLTSEELLKIPHITAAQVAAMIAHLDKPDATTGLLDGMISLDEFLAALNPVEPPLPPIPDLTVPACPELAAFDVDKNGRLSLAEVASVITALDTDGDGKISPPEWRAYVLAHPELILDQPVPRFLSLIPQFPILTPPVLAQFDTNPKDNQLSPAEMGAIVTALDTDGDGRISLAEWKAYLLANHPEMIVVREMPSLQVWTPEVLRLFDANNDHWLTSAEIAAYLAAVDTDGDGKVSLEEWKTYLLAHPELLPRPDPRAMDGMMMQ